MGTYGGTFRWMTNRALLVTTILVGGVMGGSLLPVAAVAGVGSIDVGDPTQDGEVTITIFIGVDANGTHGIPVTKTIKIKGSWDADRKAKEIRKKIKTEVQRNGATVGGTGTTVSVTNNTAAWPVDVTKSKDSTGEADTTQSSSEGNPSAPPEDISYRTRLKLEGVPVGGLITVGADDLVMTVPTGGMSIPEIYTMWQGVFGGTIQSEGLVLPPRVHSSALPYSKSYQYEVTDPGLQISIQQENEFPARDVMGGDCRLTVTDHGTLGFYDGTLENGTGFVYPEEGQNQLYLGGVWLGLGPEEVLNRDYDDDPSPDWEVSTDPLGFPSYEQLPNYAHALTAISRAQHPDGTDVTTRLTAATITLRDDLDDFVLLTVRHDCVGPRVLTGAYSGIFLDLDINGSFDDDFGSVVDAGDLVYLTGAQPGDPFIGLAVARTSADCSHELPVHASLIPNPVYVWPNQYIADADKYGFLSGSDPEYQITDAPEPGDYSVVASVGPFDLAPGDSREVQFVLVGGATLDEMLANLETAQSIVCDGGMLPAGVEDDSAVSADGLTIAAFPNPTVGPTRLSYQLSERGPVSIDVFDSAGRRVRAIESGDRPAGRNELQWDGRDDRGRTVPTGTYFARVRTPGSTGTTQITLVR
ncbi:MAG: T9SS type A sorting domain-containing protein [Candidatus Eisenbacteria bacterium]|uniref:T9SS type A sorting domain-containing protein n=1 Tax=Eiseniibacteriota bacterium TaxID=2212470 RepID=A0A956RPX0_UNCEI|nr:T9SS type A sorting domain-containing protein [Candidatus Eisenbacteria bacterium]